MGAADHPQVLSVQLTMTPELAGELQRETGALEVAQAYVVDSPQMAVAANDELKLIKARIVRLKELKAGFVAPAKQIIANAEALFDPPLTALSEGEKYLKLQLTQFTEAEERRAEEARRARETEERRLRQDAERKAASERARAEEVAREERRKAAEAEAVRVKAEAEGNAKAAARAAADAAAAEARANASIENGAAKALQLELSASAAPTTIVVPESTKLEGFSTRDNWTAELDSGLTEDHAKLMIVGAIAGGRHDLAPLLKLDMPAANKLAKALKKSMHAPGLRAVNRPVAASTGR